MVIFLKKGENLQNIIFTQNELVGTNLLNTAIINSAYNVVVCDNVKILRGGEAKVGGWIKILLPQHKSLVLRRKEYY